MNTFFVKVGMQEINPENLKRPECIRNFKRLVEEDKNIQNLKI